jgi:hypothetical protein
MNYPTSLYLIKNKYIKEIDFMSKTNISLNDKNYSIDEAALAEASASLKSHLTTVMNGHGATISLGGTSYNIDSTKLSIAKDDFVSHLGAIAGNGERAIVGGVEYYFDSAKVADAVSDLETILGNLKKDDVGGDDDDGGDVSGEDIRLLSFDNFILKDSNGLYLTTKEIY